MKTNDCMNRSIKQKNNYSVKTKTFFYINLSPIIFLSNSPRNLARK